MKTVREGDRLHYVRPNEKFRTVMRDTPSVVFHKPKRFGWIADLAWKLLSRMGALHPYIYPEKVREFRYDESKAEGVRAKLLEMREDLAEHFEDPDRFVVIMGEATFMEIARSEDFGREMLIDTDLAYRPKYRQISGMAVWVVPYMKGMGVVPRVIIEKVIN